MNWKRKLAFLALPALFALAAGALAVHAASTPTPAPAASQNETGTENQAEDPSNAAGQVDQPEAGQMGASGTDAQSGHNDAGAQADHQFDGNE